MAVLGENGGRSLRFWFCDSQKALSCAEPRRLTYFGILRQNRCTRLGCRLSQEPKNSCHFVPRGAKSRMRRTKTPKPIWIKFGVVVDIPNIVTYTNFGDHRLRGFWVAGGQIFPSPIDFHRRPYNTLALLPHSFIPGLKHHFFANPSHRSIPSSGLTTDSPDCLTLLLSISVFYFIVFFFPPLFSCCLRAVD